MDGAVQDCHAPVQAHPCHHRAVLRRGPVERVVQFHDFPDHPHQVHPAAGSAQHRHQLRDAGRRCLFRQRHRLCRHLLHGH